MSTNRKPTKQDTPEQTLELGCPACGRLLLRVAPDATGYVEPYCPRCKKRRPFTLPVARVRRPSYHTR